MELRLHEFADIDCHGASTHRLAQPIRVRAYIYGDVRFDFLRNPLKN